MYTFIFSLNGRDRFNHMTIISHSECFIQICKILCMFKIVWNHMENLIILNVEKSRVIRGILEHLVTSSPPNPATYTLRYYLCVF